MAAAGAWGEGAVASAVTSRWRHGVGREQPSLVRPASHCNSRVSELRTGYKHSRYAATADYSDRLCLDITI